MDTALWMARDLLTATPDTPLPIAARQMAARHVRHMLVVDLHDAHRLVGLVSSHDLFLAADSGIRPDSPRAIDGHERTLAAIMTMHPATIPSRTSIAEAARILRDRKFGCLPVVDRGELVGILTEHDILRAFLRMSGADQPGYEVTAVVGDSRDVLGRLHALAEPRHLRLVSASVFDHERKRYAVVHFVGGPDDAFVDSLWASGLTILRVRASSATLPAGAHT